MNRKEIRIGKASEETLKQRVAAVWESAERGENLPEAAEQVTFEEFETLLKILTPGRMNLLKALRARGPSSIRSLSKDLKRDYKNVHTDVQALVTVGFIHKGEDGRVSVPWDKLAISAEIPLVA